MIEIFEEIPEEVKEQVKFIVNLALAQPVVLDGINMVKAYRDSCSNEEEKSFVDFYFNMEIGRRLNN